MKIYQMTNSTQTQMMGFLLQTAQGHIIAVDGGMRGDTGEFVRLVKQLGGHIAYWFLTHPHNDHNEVFIALSEDARGITVGKACWSSLPDAFADNEAVFRDNLLAINRCARTTPFTLHELHDGDQFTLDGMTIDVLGVSNPDLTDNAFNDSSCVLRVEENGFAFLILGDLGVEGGRRLLERHADSVRAQAVQMAHHGQSGVEEAVYRAIRPTYAFWPTPDWLWTNTIDASAPGQGPWKTLEVRAWMRKLGTTDIVPLTHSVVFDSADGSVREI